jgi:small-conductance mechanosensitive channel
MDFLQEIADYSEYLYAAIIGGIAILLIVYVVRITNRASDKSAQVIDKIKRVDPLHPDLLSKRAKAKQKEELAERVDQRFSIIKRSIVSFIILIALLVGSIPFIGKIPTTFLSLLLTGFTVVLGIAARPFVENMISGVVISLSNQLRVGDTLYLDEQYGTVEDILITHTRIKTWDWKRYVIPNSRMLTKEFVNLTLKEKKLWAFLEFYISYDADIKKVESIACEGAKKSEYCSDVDDPQFWVIRMEPDTVVCWVAAWADSPANAWGLKSDMAKSLLMAFQKEGIKTNITNFGLKDGEELPAKSKAKPKPKAKAKAKPKAKDK